MARGFRNIIFGASVYVDGESYLGEADTVTLPDLQTITDDQRNMGMPGPGGTVQRLRAPDVRDGVQRILQSGHGSVGQP